MPKDYKRGADRGHHGNHEAKAERSSVLKAIRDLEKAMPEPKGRRRSKNPQVKRYWPV